MALSFTVLGCGSSGGVPRIDGNWGACDPADPRNRRRRCAGLIERRGDAGVTRVLIDTPPDIRESLLAAHTPTLDGVLFTHDHADHTHGIDELRVFALNTKARVRVYSSAETGAEIMRRFDYCFRNSVTGSYPAILKNFELRPLEPVAIEGRGGVVECLPFPQEHGEITSLGFRVGGLAYSPDVSGISSSALPALEGLDVWIVDALRPAPHPSHFSVDQALAWIARLKPKRAILTHLHFDLDYETLRRRLPDHVEPAHDGMVIEIAH
jgi:phosphoribosyl 1,2-cyclic phosphate phosphodiesterase